MKLKRSKYVRLFFLLSFFFSISTNICLASIESTELATTTYSKDHLHFNEPVLSASISDLLFEENENEDENELDLDLSHVLIPFFLNTFSFQNIQDHFCDPSSSVIPTEEPIYIKVSNFRI